MNSLQIAGRIGRDAEIKKLQSGDQLCEFSVAVSERKKGEDVTLWVRCALFGDRAEKLAQYLTKGTPVAVTGRAGVSAWQGKDGGIQCALELAVNNITLLGSKADGNRAETTRAPAAKPAPAAIDDGDVPF